MHYVYIIECADNTLYTGYTTDLERRIEEHNGNLQGGAKYTAGRGPVKLQYSEEFASRSEAQSREYEIKALTKFQKEALIEESVSNH